MKFASRKYIDLIHCQSGKWANWDPPIPIQVGDYGTVDKESGVFRKEGSIYDIAFALLCPDVMVNHYVPLQAEGEENVMISSSGVRRKELTLEPAINIPGLAEASLKGEWQFQNGKRGALLIMHKPRITYLPPNTILEDLAKLPVLQDKSLVTEAFTCPAYSLYLSSKDNDKISLALIGSVPVAPNLNIHAGGNFGVQWWSANTSALHRQACHPDGKYSYTPLFTLRQKKKPSPGFWRAHSLELHGDDCWDDVDEPWQSLDENGEEIIDEDEER